MFLLRLVDAFEKNGVQYGIVGGTAVALHGAVRGTLDIDFVLPLIEEQFVLAESALRSIGLTSQLPITAKLLFENRKAYAEEKNLIAWTFVNLAKPSEIVDLLISENLDQMQTIEVKIQDQSVRVVAVDDIIRMKNVSGRRQDLSDVKALEALK